MVNFEQFEQEIHDALGHLYDPTYEPPALLRSSVGGDEASQTELVQSAIIEEIQNLKPTTDVPSHARASRIYQLLSFRYLEQLSQEKTAELLNITPRHLRREQQAAVRVLAQRLWHQFELPVGHGARDTTGAESVDRIDTGSASGTTNWRSQIQEELASLYSRVPGTVADVNIGVEGAMKLAHTLADRHNVGLEIVSIAPGLIANIHPSALRQLLVACVDELVQHMTTGDITLQVRRNKDRVQFAFDAQPPPTGSIADSTLVKEILKAHGGSAHIRSTEAALTLQIDLPSPDTATVVVIDDNADLVHFYRRYTAQTRYQIVHLGEGQNLLERIRHAAPDVIVLDIMLQEVDGWELLTHIREYQDTRSVPVIVCSVIRHRELALALGASLYLPKPVRRSEFVRALDRVLNENATAS